MPPLTIFSLWKLNKNKEYEIYLYKAADCFVQGCGTDLRKDLEEAFEEFYHNTDLMESNIRLALQQCLNTLQVIQTIAPSHVNFLIPQRQPPSSKLFFI